jgi:hypothetical protein
MCYLICTHFASLMLGVVYFVQSIHWGIVRKIDLMCSQLI